MKIIKTYNWSRRDFSYDAKCEHCGNEEKHGGGYDDDNYYNNVIPSIKCGKCGESTNSKPTENIPRTITIPRYDPNIVM